MNHRDLNRTTVALVFALILIISVVTAMSINWGKDTEAEANFDNAIVIIVSDLIGQGTAMGLALIERVFQAQLSSRIKEPR